MYDRSFYGFCKRYMNSGNATGWFKKRCYEEIYKMERPILLKFMDLILTIAGMYILVILFLFIVDIVLRRYPRPR